MRNNNFILAYLTNKILNINYNINLIETKQKFIY